MIKFVNVVKNFGGIKALDNVSFEVGDGEFAFLAGPSGSGKTTILRLIMGELKPDTGQIVIGRQDITKFDKREIPVFRQSLGVVFQDFKLLNERTVRENIEVALAVIGLSQDEWPKRVDHVLKLVGLTDRSELFPSQLSGGEIQRVSLARALVVNPKLIIADEPTGNLDWETADEIMQLFAKINKEGKTILVASHHEALIKKMGKKVIRIKKGKVEAVDNDKKAARD